MTQGTDEVSLHVLDLNFDSVEGFGEHLALGLREACHDCSAGQECFAKARWMLRAGSNCNSG